MPGDGVASLSAIVDQYEEIRGVINSHAPLNTKNVTLCDGSPWMNPTVPNFRRRFARRREFGVMVDTSREIILIIRLLSLSTHCSYRVLRLHISALLLPTAVVTKEVSTGSSTLGWVEQSSAVYPVIRVLQVLLTSSQVSIRRSLTILGLVS